MSIRLLRRPRSADRWIAAGFVVAAAVEAVVRSADPTYLFINLTGAPLLFVLALRRRRPLVVVTTICVGAVIGSLAEAWLVPDAANDVFVPIIAVLVAMYSVGVHGTRRQVALAAPQPLVVVVATDLLLPSADPLLGAVIVFSVFFVTLPVLGGRLVRGRALLIHQLDEQGRRLAEHRSAYVAEATARERLRISGDLDLDLAEGLAGLVDGLPAAGSSIDGSDLVAVESRARDLLAATRVAVVALADAPVPAVEPPAADGQAWHDDREAAQPWIVLAAAALAAGLLVELRDVATSTSRAVVVAASVVLPLPLAFAWARPLPAITALWVATVAFAHLVAPLDGSITATGFLFVPPFVVAALEPRRAALAGLAVCWVGTFLLLGAAGFPAEAVVATASWAAGVGFRERTRLIDQIRANNAALEEQRLLVAARAVTDERLRIARELHDAVGHALTVVAVQAGAARRVWDSDPARAESMLDTVRSVAATGLDELRDGLSATAAHEATSLDELLAVARATGVLASASIDDHVVDDLSPPGVEAVYRVIQEALTNVLKHSPGATANLDVHRTAGGVEVAIVNRGATTRVRPSPSSGRGLEGMRRRVASCGGTLTYGPEGDGGFGVHARLPTPGVSA